MLSHMEGMFLKRSELIPFVSDYSFKSASPYVLTQACVFILVTDLQYTRIGCIFLSQWLV